MEIVAAATGVAKSQVLALNYLSPLEIRRSELFRYLAKSSNLTLCYLGFSPKLNRKQALGAARAGFLSTAFDVATDWRDQNGRWRTILEKILRCEATSPKSVQIALELFEKDSSKTLVDDGLERGILAFRFVLIEMGLMEYFTERTSAERTSIDNLGVLLQIVDDILDLEDDIKEGDLNCIQSPRWKEYLHRLVREMPDERIKALFPNSSLLFHVIRSARIRAEKILIMERENEPLGKTAAVRRIG